VGKHSFYATLAVNIAVSLGEPMLEWVLQDPHVTANQLSGLETQTALFSKTGNPFYAWEAYVTAINCGGAVPEVVRNYIDNAARLFMRAYHAYRRNDSPNDPAEAFAVAFGIKKPRTGKPPGRGTIFSSVGTEGMIQSDGLRKVVMHGPLAIPPIFLRNCVSEFIAAGDKEDEAVRRTAEEYGLSVSAVRKAWVSHRDATKHPGAPPLHPTRKSPISKN
jgi:hypothetical protein